MTKRLEIEFRLIPDGNRITVKGRDAWALMELLKAGPRGVTPIDNPGPRWSAYVFNLRAMGLAIETIHESHGGRFPGSHARYVLRSEIEVMEAANAEA